ncbi:hypothetical protein SEA_CRUNCHYBOI_50 [Microbacterium phage CrunchyBoi]|nr:hypothetical protein SEA_PINEAPPLEPLUTO_50 [Microbacterium phage PineapplePluto]QQO39393.1 hypothetical protein SEA_CRUNCHYBOI_50 [Microbacterium phage CrunchyBoi]
MPDLPRKSILYRELKLAQESGVDVVFPPGVYVNWTEAQLEAIHLRTFGAVQEESTSEEIDSPELIPEAGDLWARVAAEAQQEAAGSPAPEPVAAPAPQATAPAPAPQSGAPEAAQPLKDRPLEWAQYRPRDLALALGLPYNDRPAERAGLTFNTHGPNDPLRVDSNGRVWYRDEVLKPAIPKRRMIRKTTTMSSNVVEIKTKRPDGGFDESFEIAGDEQHEVQVKITMPSSQVGIYRDPRFPFKIHQYNGRRGFDFEEVRNYYGGLDLVPTTIKTIYIDSDLCFDMNSVRDTIEREYNMRVLGRNVL